MPKHQDSGVPFMTWFSRLLPQSPRLRRVAGHNHRTRQGQRRRRMANLETLEDRTLLSNVVTRPASVMPKPFSAQRIHWFGQGLLTRPSSATAGLPVPTVGASRGDLRSAERRGLETLRAYAPLFPAFLRVFHVN